MEAIKYSEANLVVYIPPSKLGDVSAAVKLQLSSFLFKYGYCIDICSPPQSNVEIPLVLKGFNETFGGVLLAYDFDIKCNLAKILSLYPFIGVNLKANLLLFAPKPDTYLEGKVVKLAQDAIHIVALGFSAAIITEEDIRDEFRFKIKHGREIFRSTSHKRHVIKVGTVIRFLVKSFDEETLHICGSLEQPTTGDIRWLSKNSEELSSVASVSRKREDIEGIKEEQSIGTIDGAVLSIDSHVSRKSKKQRLHEG